MKQLSRKGSYGSPRLKTNVKSFKFHKMKYLTDDNLCFLNSYEI